MRVVLPALLLPLAVEGPGALVDATVPVNKFPDFVAAMVSKLKRLFPVMGRRRIADFLARAGLHIAPSPVRRMLNRAPATETPAPVAPAKNPDEPLSSAKPRTRRLKSLREVPSADQLLSELRTELRVKEATAGRIGF
jgi:hypothetical protein